MQAIFDKLNLKDQKEILVLAAPEGFGKELKKLKGVKVAQRMGEVKSLTFALAFVTKQAELDKLSKALAAKADGDALLWFAYPKGTSKKYSCDFNRDEGWGVLHKAGFDTARQIAIDADWTALRFRRVEFIKRPK
ncbi:MAG TPA: hypothetical protein VGO35_11475 [Gammaproteobacteria bacterium]|jgi:hypothetical protein|nr:hypothetical protein [Gammaproteobacteria bacterium]